MAIPLYSKATTDTLLAAKYDASNPSGFISDAPIDGNTYGRNNGAWAIVSGGGGASWGSISGTLSSQTDLWTALGNKADVSGSTAISVSGSGGTSTLGADSGATVSADNGSGSVTKLTTTGITFPDSTTQTTAATYDAKKAIANLAASCFTTNGSTIGFTNYIAAAVAQGSKFQTSSAYLLGIGTPGYGPTTLTLTYSSATWADSGVSWGSYSGQAIAYSDDYGTTWTYSDLTF